MPKYPKHTHEYGTTVDEEVDEKTGAGTGKVSKTEACRICGKTKGE